MEERVCEARLLKNFSTSSCAFGKVIDDLLVIKDLANHEQQDVGKYTKVFAYIPLSNFC